MAGGDQARVSVRVNVPIEDAFDIFTREIDQWWRRGARFRNAGARSGMVCLEPGVGGRLFESIDAKPPIVHEIGRVVVWEPPRRVQFTWRSANFAPGEVTNVEVSFEPLHAGTLVTVTHRGWAALRDDHPARHGLTGQAFSHMIAGWWGEQMSALRQVAAARTP
jgi:uncharacterized protein YndB with AHSA1/START domain